MCENISLYICDGNDDVYCRDFTRTLNVPEDDEDDCKEEMKLNEFSTSLSFDSAREYQRLDGDRPAKSVQ